jgi:hypothetical protein
MTKVYHRDFRALSSLTARLSRERWLRAAPSSAKTDETLFQRRQRSLFRESTSSPALSLPNPSRQFVFLVSFYVD